MTAGRRAKQAVRSMVPVRTVRFVQRNRGRFRHAQQRRFDRRHGVETAGLVHPNEMDIAPEGRAEAHLYEPTWHGSVRRMIRSLDIDLATCTFVDVGSGKGPVLLYASEFPFRRAIGIEHDRALHDVAVRNIERFHPPTRRCPDVSSVHADATTYDLPDDPLVVFLCNPFEGSMLATFMARFEASVRATPRPVRVITFNPGIEHALDGAGWLARTASGWSHATYRSTVADAG